MVIYWLMDEAGPEGAGLISDSPDDQLSVEEWNRFRQMRFPKRRSEWLSGRLTAKKLIVKCVPDMENVPYAQITIANSAAGAPYARTADKILAVQLSISHREGWAAAAVNLNTGISLGIDLEWVEDHPLSFYEDFFTADEVRALGEYAAEQRAWAGSLTWSAKEAVLKALSQGLSVDTRAVEVLRIAKHTVDGWGEIELRVANMANESWFGFWRNQGQHVLTLAVRGAKTRPEIKQAG
ncbi:MAG: 4'-phosphopantetheinyl transferase family protein [Bellilinea sp.]